MLVGQSSSVCLALIIDTIVAQTTLHWLWLTCQNYSSKLLVFNIFVLWSNPRSCNLEGCFSVHHILVGLWHVAIYFKALFLSLSNLVLVWWAKLKAQNTIFLQEIMLRYGLRLVSLCVYFFYVDPCKEVLKVSAFVSFSFSRIFFLGFKELMGHHLLPGQLKTRQIWFQVPFWPMSFLCEWRTHFSIMDYWNGIIAGHFKIDQYGCTPFKLAL